MRPLLKWMFISSLRIACYFPKNKCSGKVKLWLVINKHRALSDRSVGFLLLSELLTFMLCFVKKTKTILVSRKYKFTLENSESKNTGKEVKDKKPQNPWIIVQHTLHWIVSFQFCKKICIYAYTEMHMYTCYCHI